MPDVLLFFLILIGMLCVTALAAKWMDMRDLHKWRRPNSTEKDAKIFDAVEEAQNDLEDGSESGGEIRH